MSEERQLLVGIDLGDDITQISCFDFKRYEPIPVGKMTGKEREYEIPMVVAINPNKSIWLWGSEAQEPGEGFVKIDGIMSKVCEGDRFEADGYTFKSRELLKRFLIKELSLLKEYYPNNTICKLVISVSDKTERITECLRTICSELGIGSDRLIIQSHKQSYMYYAVSQDKELWVNNVGLFEYDSKGLRYSQINIDRSSVPGIVGVTQKDLSDVMSGMMLITEDDAHMRYAFTNVAKTVLHKQRVTTIYVTGKGFDGEWAADALKDLCNGRRVFRGQNLFTRGACYAAREISGEGKLSDFVFLDDEMITSDITIKVYKDAGYQEVELAKAGTMWSEVDSSIDVIPDAEDEIQITARNILKHEFKSHMLSLSSFAGRENRMTRFTIRIRFADRNTCIVTLKDNGFGEFCPSSNRIWETQINV